MSKENYPGLRKWSDQFIPTIRQILGPIMVGPAPEYEDTQEATDLMLINARDRRIACRVRGYQYAEKYGDEFTIRYQANVKTYSEFHKIISGHADWLFYGFEGIDGPPTIGRWHIVDLHAFRYHVAFNRDLITWGIKSNGPNDPSKLAWFDIKSFPEDPAILVMASYSLN